MRNEEARSRARTVGLVALVGLLCIGPPAAADVVETSEHGFVVETSVDVAATPEEVWERLVRVGEWWNAEHSFSAEASNLRLEAVPGGCFCEALPDGGGLIHLTVVHVAPGSLLRLSGGLGPLQEFAVAGVMDWRLEATDGGTRVTFAYRVFGVLPDGPDAWAEPVDGVIAEQLQRLQGLVEAGSPTAPAGAPGR